MRDFPIKGIGNQSIIYIYIYIYIYIGFILAQHQDSQYEMDDHNPYTAVYHVLTMAHVEVVWNRNKFTNMFIQYYIINMFEIVWAGVSVKFALKTINLTALGPWVFRHCARPGQQLGLCVVPWPVRPPRDRADRADSAWRCLKYATHHHLLPFLWGCEICAILRLCPTRFWYFLCASLCSKVKRDPDEGSFSRDGVTRELLLSHFESLSHWLLFFDIGRCLFEKSPPRTNNDTQQQVLDLLEQKCGGSESMPIPVDMVGTVAWLVILRDSRSHVDEAGIPGHDVVVCV